MMFQKNIVISLKSISLICKYWVPRPIVITMKKMSCNQLTKANFYLFTLNFSLSDNDDNSAKQD